MSRPSKPSPEKASARPLQKMVKKHNDYTSEGVVDSDVFLLPVSDYQTMFLVTIVAAVVRLFRIYQPSSVVFDEVQYVCNMPACTGPKSNQRSSPTVSADSHPSTSRDVSSWTSTPL
jgi:hypothetical protein